MKWWDWMPCSWMLSFKPDSSLPSFIFIKRLFSSSLLPASIFGLCLKMTVSRSTSLAVLEQDFPGDAMVKTLPAKAGDTEDVGLTPVLGRSPWRKKWQLTPVFLPGEFLEQRSQVGYSPWGQEQLDMTEHTTKHTCLGDLLTIPLHWNDLEMMRVHFFGGPRFTSHHSLTGLTS